MRPNPVLDFKSLFETAPGLSLVLYPDFTIAAVSEGYLKATMTVREKILGHNLFEIFPDNPNDSEANGVLNLRASLNYVLSHQQPHAMVVQKYDIRRPDGIFEERHWSPLNTPVLNIDKEVACIIHTVTDVTDQHIAENNLKKTEQDFQLLVNNVKDYAIIMIDLEGCVASWNSGSEYIHGYKREEIIGSQIDVFYTADQLKTEASKINLQKALQDGHFETEDWQVRKDASIFWANIVYTALRDAKGLLYGYSKITRDITERKKSWEQVALLSRQINQSNDAIYTLDSNLKIKSWNKGAENLYGFTEKEALEKNSNELLQTDITDVAVSNALKKLTSEDYWTGELKRVTRSGKPIYVKSSTTNIRNKDGIITGYVAVSIDITQQKKLGEEINHLAKIVEQSSEAIFSIDRDHCIISWNGGAKKLFGLTKEEALQKKCIGH